MLVLMINTSSLVNNTRNHEICFEVGFAILDFSFRVIKSKTWFR